MKAESDAQKIIEDARNSTHQMWLRVFHALPASPTCSAHFRPLHHIVDCMTDRNFAFTARRAQVKRAQDEAKTEIDAYRRTLEEDFKKKQDEVSIRSTIYMPCDFDI